MIVKTSGSEVMLKIGEIKRGGEIGKQIGQGYIWHACEGCGKERWVRVGHGQAGSKICRSCSALLHQTDRQEKIGRASCRERV